MAMKMMGTVRTCPYQPGEILGPPLNKSNTRELSRSPGARRGLLPWQAEIAWKSRLICPKKFF
jgi:hypothetical protein